MPQQPDTTEKKRWDEYTAAERGAIVRQYGGEEMQNVWNSGNGGKGLTDEELGNNPVLWPPAVGPDGKSADNPNDEQAMFDNMIGTLRAEGNPLMRAIDEGKYEEFVAQQSQNPDTFDPTDPGIYTDGATNYSDLSYNPNRGLSEWDFQNFTGVRPGSSIDVEQYKRTAEEIADLNRIRERANDIANRDINQFSIDPSTLQPVDTFTYDANLADIYATEVDGVFDPTRTQLGYANDLVGRAASADGTALGEAAALQAAAARGESPLFADARLARDADRMFQQQMMAAARARGSSSAGLAARAAANNAAFGYGQLVNDANAARVAEMSAARDAYAQTGQNIRAGDLQAASQAADVGQLLYGVNNAELGANMANTEAMNRGSMFNTEQGNAANQFNVQQSAAADAANSQQVYDTLKGNVDRAFAAQASKDTLTGAYDDKILGAGEADRANRILAEQNFDESSRNSAAVLANVYSGVATNQTQLTGQREAAGAQKDASIIGAAGAGLGAIAGAAILSDPRAKTVGGDVPPADFSRIDEKHWMYNGAAGPLAGKQGNGGMAPEYPPDTLVRAPNGMLAVDKDKLVMRQSGAIGDIQRRLMRAGL